MSNYCLTRYLSIVDSTKGDGKKSKFSLIEQDYVDCLWAFNVSKKPNYVTEICSRNDLMYVRSKDGMSRLTGWEREEIG